MKHLVFRIFLIQYFGLQLNLFLRKRQILFITSHMLFIYLQINSTDTIGTELNLFAGAESGNSYCTGNSQLTVKLLAVQFSVFCTINQINLLQFKIPKFFFFKNFLYYNIFRKTQNHKKQK